MSGMAGNVTAFNTVWTYDLYQAYIAPNKSDEHYFWMGRAITVVGILLSIACAYFASHVQQRDGHHPARVRLRERAAVRHVPAGHVLGAHHGHGRLPRPARRHGHLGPLPRADHRRRQRAGRQGRLPRRRADLPQRNGPELLAGQLRLHRLLRADRWSSRWRRGGPRPTRNSRAWSIR